MNYSEIKKFDIANGVGVRTSLFVSGCRRHCKGCFNPNTWDFDAGEPFTKAVIDDIVDSIDNPNVDGLSVLGGEPLEHENIPWVEMLISVMRLRCTGKDVWLWTGYTFEELDDEQRNFVEDMVDVLVDGPFVEGLKDITLRFRGSSNQRIIDVKKSVEAGKVVPWTDGPVLSIRSWWSATPRLKAGA